MASQSWHYKTHKVQESAPANGGVKFTTGETVARRSAGRQTVRLTQARVPKN